MKKLLSLILLGVACQSYALTGKVTLSPQAKDGGVIIKNLEHYPIRK